MANPTLELIETGHVVAIYYTLRDASGRQLDTNKTGGPPLTYLAGAGNIVPGLDKALIGQRRGTTVKAVVAPQDAYGLHNPEALERMPRAQFPAQMEIKPGMVFTGRTPDGLPVRLRVGSVDGDQVVIDKNHPLAGQELHFEVYIYGVRDATDEERQHGHAHGAGGHHH
jgi:FKBP-type peptidyl-prolyl cis-trans isomerase SlyD